MENSGIEGFSWAPKSAKQRIARDTEACAGSMLKRTRRMPCTVHAVPTHSRLLKWHILLFKNLSQKREHMHLHTARCMHHKKHLEMLNMQIPFSSVLISFLQLDNERKRAFSSIRYCCLQNLREQQRFPPEEHCDTLLQHAKHCFYVA